MKIKGLKGNYLQFCCASGFVERSNKLSLSNETTYTQKFTFQIYDETITINSIIQRM